MKTDITKLTAEELEELKTKTINEMISEFDFDKQYDNIRHYAHNDFPYDPVNDIIDSWRKSNNKLFVHNAVEVVFDRDRIWEEWTALFVSYSYNVLKKNFSEYCEDNWSDYVDCGVYLELKDNVYDQVYECIDCDAGEMADAEMAKYDPTDYIDIDAMRCKVEEWAEEQDFSGLGYDGPDMLNDFLEDYSRGISDDDMRTILKTGMDYNGMHQKLTDLWIDGMKDGYVKWADSRTDDDIRDLCEWTYGDWINAADQYSWDRITDYIIENITADHLATDYLCDRDYSPEYIKTRILKLKGEGYNKDNENLDRLLKLMED